MAIILGEEQYYKRVRALSSEIFLRIYEIEGALSSVLCIDSLECDSTFLYRNYSKKVS